MQTSPRYPLSPSFMGPESHTIPQSIRSRTTPMKLEKIPEKNIILKNTASDEELTFDVGAHGKMVGGGAHGKVYNCKVTRSLIDELKLGLSGGANKIFNSFPDLDSYVIIKVVTQSKDFDDKEFSEDVVHENIVHSKLSSIKCNPDIIACVSQFVPKFFLSFILGKSRKHMSITVMDYAGDKTLEDYAPIIMHKGEESVQFYARVERIVCSLWIAGYIHGDLHRKNMMVNSSTGEVKLIDFGFAEKMSSSFSDFISNGIVKMISDGSVKSLADVWNEDTFSDKSTVAEYSNRIMASRGFPWYHPDNKFLKVVYNQIIPRGSTKLLPGVRSKLWGIPIGFIKSPRQKSPNSQTPAGNTMLDVNTGKVDAKKRKVFKDSKGRTYVKQGDKKVYVRKLFTLGATSSPSKNPMPSKSPVINTEKVDAKKRKVFKDSKGRTYVKQGDKKVFVKKLFTPSATTSSPVKSPVINTEKVDAKKRKVFKDSKGRTYVKQGDKKVFVKKLFTPLRP